MAYREIGISIRSAYTQGWPDNASEFAFRTETRKLFRDAGWQVEEKPLGSAHCDKVRNGKDALYLHLLALRAEVERDDDRVDGHKVLRDFFRRRHVGEHARQHQRHQRLDAQKIPDPFLNDLHLQFLLKFI